MSSEVAITIEEATKTYDAFVALNQISLSIATGSSVAFLGPNGAGKTTLLQMILGATSIDSGAISVFGQSPGSVGVRLRSGAMLQVTGVPATLTVREHIELFRSYYLEPLEYLKVIDLAHLKGLERRKYGTLSGGEKQRLHFALAIAGNPDLLFLDEPTTALDVETRIALWNQISEFTSKECTVVLNTHNLEEAEVLANRVVLIDAGQVVVDETPRAIRSMVGKSIVSAVTETNFESLRQLPGVIDVQVVNNRAKLIVSTTEETVRALLNLDANLTGLEVKPVQLEDAYLQLLSKNDIADREQKSST
ncbi:MAG: ABC transporter ATP-binding protein [Gammaproteobacteria bacterium]|nr:ABC transporter ATP-binding protein [Gammaproteobacteria bacterium]